MAEIQKAVVSATDGLKVVRLQVAAGGVVPTHHANVDVVATVVRGAGEFVVEGAPRAIKAGDVVVMGPKVPHSISATTELELVVVHARLATAGAPASCGA